MNSTAQIHNRKPFGADKIDGVFWLFIGCLLAGVLYSVTHFALLGIATAVVICAYVFVSPTEECYVFLFGMQFLRAVLPVQLGSSAFGFILFAYAVLLFKMCYRQEKLYGEYLVLACLLVLDVVCSTVGGTLHIGDTFNWVFSCFYLIYILKNKAREIDFEKLFLFFLLAQWAVCLVNIFAELRIFGRSLVPDMYGVWVDGYELFSFGKAYSAVAGGNEIAFNNALAIALAVMMFPYVKKVGVRVFYVISILFLGYCGFLLIARGFYVELIAFLAIYALSSIKNPRQLITYFCVFCLIGVAFYFFAYDIILVTLERVLVRFEGGNSARESLLSQAFELLGGDPAVFLCGAGSYYPDRFGFTAHNHYVDAVLSLGLFGGLLYFAVIAKTMYQSFCAHAKISIRAVLPLLMLLSYKLISGSVRDVGFYYYLGMVVLFAIYLTRRQEHEIA